MAPLSPGQVRSISSRPGVSGDKKISRLFLVSAGNTSQDQFGNGDYLAVCDHPDNELDPHPMRGTRFCVGGLYREECPTGWRVGVPLAPVGRSRSVVPGRPAGHRTGRLSQKWFSRVAIG